MIRAWQETWGLSDGGSVLSVKGSLASIVEHYEGQNDQDRARLRLASTAPEMARLLLKLGAQFSEVSDDGFRRCACCGGEAHSVHPVPHAPDCALDAALRKAGVR